MKLKSIQEQYGVVMTADLSERLKLELREFGESAVSTSNIKDLILFLSIDREIMLLQAVGDISQDEAESNINRLLTQAARSRVIRGDQSLLVELKRRRHTLLRSLRTSGVIENESETPSNPTVQSAIRTTTAELLDQLSHDVAVHHQYSHDLGLTGNSNVDNTRLRTARRTLANKIKKKVEALADLGVVSNISAERLLEHSEEERCKLLEIKVQLLQLPPPAHTAAGIDSFPIMTRKRLVDLFENVQRLDEELIHLRIAMKNFLVFCSVHSNIAVRSLWR